jgi:YebC/PmpR family DNA-binding regulatory protein
MSGHSHFAGIKHRKGINDAKRAKVFTKLAKPIVIAARDGGGNPDTNFRLRLAIDKAREFNMPKDNIERAIKRGTGELKDAALEEIIYEAMGPGGVMMLIKTTTDNRNRTLGEIKTILTKNSGKFGEAGSAMWNFRKVGNINITVPKGADPYEIEMKAIDAGAEDTLYSGDIITTYTRVEDFQMARENLEKEGFAIESSELVYAPLQKTELSENDKLDYEKLLESLDEQDDVEEIYDNL